MNCSFQFFIRVVLIVPLGAFFVNRIVKAIKTGIIEANSIKKNGRIHYQRNKQPYSYLGMIFLYLIFVILFTIALLK